MRVLVTGHRGYIGTVVTSVLRNSGCDVVGLDCDLYGACDFGRVRDEIPSFDIDLRELEFTDLLSFDSVLHLAALSDDACGAIDADLTRDINENASVRLAELCKQAGVSRLLFASTCGVYGSKQPEESAESSPVDPQTEYTRSKLAAERQILALADHSFRPLVLRLATTYGVSPRMRLDTVVNEFVGSAIVNGRIILRTSGLAWRPLIHVEDAARVCLALLALPEEGPQESVLNVVPVGENYRIVDIADAVIDQVSRCARRFPLEPQDRSSYRVDGTRLARLLPQFRFRWTLDQGIRQLIVAMHGAGLTPGDWRSDKFRRALRLRAILEHHECGSDFRRGEAAVV